MLLGGGATAYTSPYISSAVSTSETCSGPPSPTTSPVSLTPLTLVQSLPPPIALDGSHHHQVSISPTMTYSDISFKKRLYFIHHQINLLHNQLSMMHHQMFEFKKTIYLSPNLMEKSPKLLM